MKTNRATVQKGNSKLGETMNISLPPDKTCVGMPCHKNGCYTCKDNRYPSVAVGRARNWEKWRTDSIGYSLDIQGALHRATTTLRPYVKFFRWHVAGEIPNQDYVVMMRRIAKLFPATRFLCFTKRYDLDFTRLPRNLKIVLSAWPGLPLPKMASHYPVAYMIDKAGKEKRHEKTARHTIYNCPGKCESCRKCWYLGTREAVLFEQH